MTNIYFIRHGETDWNKEMKVQGRTDRPLNETGIKQAEENSKFLQDIEVDYIVSSPLIRAKKTAEIFAQKNNWRQDIILDDLVIERTFGELEGYSVDEFRMISNFEDYDGYETDEEIINRVTKAVENYSKQGYNEVAVFAHSHVLKALAIKYLNQEGFVSFTLPNCAIMKVVVEDEKVLDVTMVNCELGGY